MTLEKTSIQPKQIKRFSNWTIAPTQVLIPLLVMAALMNGYLFIRNPNMGSDAMLYHSAFHNLIAGNGWTYFNGTYLWAPVEPGYGIISYLFYLVFSDIEYSGMLVSAFAYLLMIPTVYFTVNFLFGKRSALLAACLITFWPTLLSYSYINAADCAYVFILFLGFSQYIRVLLVKNNVTTNALLGLILGFAYLIREGEGLLVAILALFVLFFLAFAKLRQSLKNTRFSISSLRPFLAPITALSTFFVVALPNIFIIYAYVGVWTPTSKILPAFEASREQQTSEANYEAPEPVIGHENNTPALSEEKHIAGLEIAHSPNVTNLVKNFNALIVSLARMNIHALVTLALIWFVSPFFSTNRLFFGLQLDARNLKIWLSLAVFSSSVLLHLIIPARLDIRLLMQYSIYLLIVIAFLISQFLGRILDSWRTKNQDTWVVFICLVSILASLVFGSPTLGEVLSASHAHLGIRAAGLWLSENVQNSESLAIVSARKGQVALFYANKKTFALGRSQDVSADMTLAEIGDLLNSEIGYQRYDYLLLDNHYIAGLPLLQPLWENPDLAHSAGLSLIHRDNADFFQIYAGEKPLE